MRLKFRSPVRDAANERLVEHERSARAEDDAGEGEVLATFAPREGMTLRADTGDDGSLVVRCVPQASPEADSYHDMPVAVTTSSLAKAWDAKERRQ